jgi:putative DNA primase/helicase
MFYNTYALEFDFVEIPQKPNNWLDFMDHLWSGDPEPNATLQQWFGYCLTADKSQEKILGLFGPRRSGKGTITRVLTALLGKDNVAGPTLSGLANQFGMSSLIGKPLAIIPDARMGVKTDEATIVERLLAISSRDGMDVPRKHREPWIGILPTRLILVANELLTLRDASSALPGRLILLQFFKSFYGEEDPKLFDRFVPELPGILRWAIDGWASLRENGCFVQPKAGAEIVKEFEEIASPIHTFLRENYIWDPQSKKAEIKVADLFDAWKLWCNDMNRNVGSVLTFSKNVRAVLPSITLVRPRDEGKLQPRSYKGLRPREADEKPNF